jgi:hypothetical protein
MRISNQCAGKGILYVDYGLLHRQMYLAAEKCDLFLQEPLTATAAETAASLSGIFAMEYES